MQGRLVVLFFSFDLRAGLLLVIAWGVETFAWVRHFLPKVFFFPEIRALFLSGAAAPRRYGL